MRFWDMNRFNISEEEQRKTFTDFYKNKKERFYLEVPVFCRSVDLVKQDLQNNSITAIEFKVNDWKRAISQVLSVAICFDYLAICVPKPKTLKGQTNVINECQSNGIGLYFYDTNNNTFEHTVLEKKIDDIWEVQRCQILKYLEVR